MENNQTTMKTSKLRTKHAPKASTKVTVFQNWNAHRPCTGANPTPNLDKVVKNFKEQVKADRRAAAAERRQAEIAEYDARIKAMYAV